MSFRRSLLSPFTPLYALGVAGHRKLLESGSLRTGSLPGLVLSVGSLSAGGAGKTPFVLALAALLHRVDFAVRILSRGYGRHSRQTLVVDPAGSPADFGDEPLLLAQRSRVPVVVGRSRFEAGLLAETLHAANRAVVHILDDGFQHGRLLRDLDLVLLTAQDTTDALLPAGNLREPLSALRRADILVLRDDEAPAIERLAHALPTERSTRPVLLIRRDLRLPSSSTPPPTRPLLFSGIARPRDLPPMLAALGLHLHADPVVFPDHHRYRDASIAHLLRVAHRTGANGFVTTEKDAVKLSASMRHQLATIGPLLVPELTVSFVDEAAALASLFSLLPRLNRRRRPR